MSALDRIIAGAVADYNFYRTQPGAKARAKTQWAAAQVSAFSNLRNS